MLIYLLRHGDAAESVDDRIRPLSELGVENTQKIAEYLKSINTCIDLIITSPLLRAYQTAQIVIKVLKYDKNLLETDNLLPESYRESIINELSKYSNDSNLLLVGHQPLLGDLLAHFTKQPHTAAKIVKSALACIQIEQPINSNKGFLKWLVTPNDLINGCRKCV